LNDEQVDFFLHRGPAFQHQLQDLQETDGEEVGDDTLDEPQRNLMAAARCFTAVVWTSMPLTSIIFAILLILALYSSILNQASASLSRRAGHDICSPQNVNVQVSATSSSDRSDTKDNTI